MEIFILFSFFFIYVIKKWRLCIVGPPECYISRIYMTIDVYCSNSMMIMVSYGGLRRFDVDFRGHEGPMWEEKPWNNHTDSLRKNSSVSNVDFFPKTSEKKNTPNIELPPFFPHLSQVFGFSSQHIFLQPLCWSQPPRLLRPRRTSP